MSDQRMLKKLMARMFDGELTDRDIAALNDALAASESARIEYLDSVYLLEGLRRWAHSRGSADEWQVIRSAIGIADRGASSPDAVALLPREESAVRPRRHWVAIATVLAFVLLSPAGLFYALSWTTPDAPSRAIAFDGDPTQSEEDYALSDSDSVVARLTAATRDVRWSHGRVPSDFLMRFRPGDILGIDSGVAQVEFSGGARLVLCSPAALQFTGSSSARLMKGSVTGRADDANFALVTPTATVVDIGTEFGVGVGASGTDVTVFEGELHVHSLLNSGDAGPMRRVRKGMSMRIDSDGAPTVLHGQAIHPYRRDLLQPMPHGLIEGTISLLDLVGGHDYSRERIAASIDPRSGYWGNPSWGGPNRSRAIRGDTQFTSTPWNRMVDGVFIPRANAREMQIDSDGHMVHLPPNHGSSWGPIWTRRCSEFDRDNDFWAASHADLWGDGTLEAVHRRLLEAKEGVLGLHANVGITFDIDSLRDARGAEVVEFSGLLLNLGTARNEIGEIEQSHADLRVFVDGKLKYSRLKFNASGGEAEVLVPIGPNDRFLTLVATDSDGDPRLDHVVFVDPFLRFKESEPLARKQRSLNLHDALLAVRSPFLGQ